MKHAEKINVSFRSCGPDDCGSDFSNPLACEYVEAFGIDVDGDKIYPVLKLKKAGSIEVEVVLENKTNRTTGFTKI